MYKKVLIFIIIQVLGFLVIYEIKSSRIELYLEKLTHDITHSINLLTTSAELTSQHLYSQFLKDGVCVNSIINLYTAEESKKNVALAEVKYCFDKYYNISKEITRVSDVNVYMNNKKIYDINIHGSDIDHKVFSGLEFKQNIVINHNDIANVVTIFDLDYLISGINLNLSIDSFFISKYDENLPVDSKYTQVGFNRNFIINDRFLNKLKFLERNIYVKNFEGLKKYIDRGVDEPFVIHQKLKGKTNIVYFIPMLDEQNGINAYWIIKIEDNVIDNLIQDFIALHILVFIGISLIFTYMLKEIENRALIHERLEFKNEIISSANSGIGIINKKGDFIEVNEYYTALLGYSKRKFLDLNYIMIAIDCGKEK